MSISRDEVARLARLAHIDLDPEETERMARDLGQILDYAARLPGRPEDEPGEARPGPLREDLVERGLGPEAALEGAPDREGDLFRVPPAIGRE